MRLPLVRVGNSLCLRIPKPVLDSMGLEEGDGLFVSLNEGRLMLSRDTHQPKVRALMRHLRPMLGKEVLLAYLFGSFLTPKFRSDRSDIDLYVIVKHGEAEMEVMGIGSKINLQMGGPPLSVVAYSLRRVDWTWFEDEVLGGVPLYVDPGAFPEGVPPLSYLKEVGGPLPGKPPVQASQEV